MRAFAASEWSARLAAFCANEATMTAMDEITLAARRPRERAVRLGRVVSVTGSSAVMEVERPDGGGASAAVASQKPAGAEPQIGELVRVETSAGAAYAIISSMRLEGERQVWFAEMELMGEAAWSAPGDLGPFRRGLSAYPTLGARVFQAGRADLERAYDLGSPDPCVSVGALHQDPSLPANIRIDEMLGKHFAVLGATGTGKSCSVALILQSILDLCPHAHALMLDAHGEYARAFAGRAEVITHRDLRLPYWVLTHEEISEVLVDDQEGYRGEMELLGDLIR